MPDPAGSPEREHDMRDEFLPCVYILASHRNGTLYIGVTTHLPGRTIQHREGSIRGFTREYGVKRLIYLEICEDIDSARLRELRLKKWRRQWKIDLIERTNPDWRDLAVDLGCDPLPSTRVVSPETPRRGKRLAPRAGGGPSGKRPKHPNIDHTTPLSNPANPPRFALRSA